MCTVCNYHRGQAQTKLHILNKQRDAKLFFLGKKYNIKIKPFLEIFRLDYEFLLADYYINPTQDNWRIYLEKLTPYRNKYEEQTLIYTKKYQDKVQFVYSVHNGQMNDVYMELDATIDEIHGRTRIENG